MKKILLYVSAGLLIGSITSCQKYLDINQDPDRIVETKAPMDLLLTNVTVNTGFASGSDLFRYPALIMQQFTAQTQGGEVQTQQYEKYLLQSADVNNLWSTFNATTLNDIEIIIAQAKANGSPYYSGVAKLLKAYNYQHLVDAFGNIPYTEAQQTSANTSPKYDDAAAIYTALLALIDEAIADLNQPTSAFSPGANSMIYSGSFATKKANWIRFGNTLKLRLLIHYSKLDNAGMVSKITALVNSPSASFMTGNADTFLRGAASGGVPTGTGAYNPLPSNTPAGITYDGTAPIRMLTFAEYNFIRAEAAVYGAPGVAQTFFQAGITASMQNAGVAAVDIATYLATNGILTGSTSNMVSQIIAEKYISSYGVMQECWSDWRRTGFPAITIVGNAVIPQIPRILPYPQSEADANQKFPGQKSDLFSTANRTFWDKP